MIEPIAPTTFTMWLAGQPHTFVTEESYNKLNKLYKEACIMRDVYLKQAIRLKNK